MSIVPILNYPDPGLKRVAPAVTEFTDEIKQIIADMLESLAAQKQCGALACTQMNVPNPYRIVVFDTSTTGDKPLVCVNPEIIRTDGEVFEPEGCMSVYPDHFHDSVMRPAKATFKGLDENGNAYQMTVDGYFAKCIQHEIDHLDGKLFIDKLSPFKRKRADKKIDKIRKSLSS